VDSIFLTTMAGYQGQHGGHSRERRREPRHFREFQRRDKLTYQRNWDEDRYLRRELRQTRPRSEPPRYREGYNPYPVVMRMRPTVPVSRSPLSKNSEPTGYGGHKTRIFPRGGARPSTNRPDSRDQAPLHSHHSKLPSRQTSKVSSITECKNNSVMSRYHKKEGPHEWDMRSRPKEQDVRPCPQHVQDAPRSKRKPKQESIPGGGLAHTKECVLQPNVTTYTSAQPAKVSKKQNTVKNESSKGLSPAKVKVQSQAEGLSLPNDRKASSSSSPKVEKLVVETDSKPDKTNVADKPKSLSLDSGEKPSSPILKNSIVAPSKNSKSVTHSPASTNESSNDKQNGKSNESSVHVGSRNKEPTDVVPLRPNFGNRSTKKAKKDDFEEDMFNCPTSPLIHMSESCVPLIQRALKSAAPTIDHNNDLGRYSPDMSMSGDEANSSHNGSESKDPWTSPLPSEPLRPNFTSASQKTLSTSMAADGQRKAVRRPRRRSDHPSKHVEYLFPPTSPVPALNMRPQRLDNVSVVKLKQPLVGARPLVLLDSISQSPPEASSDTGLKEVVKSRTNKPKFSTTSYVHLSEQQQAINQKGDKCRSGLDNSELSSRVAQPVSESEQKSVLSSVAGGLENALKTLEKASNIQQESKGGNSKRPKRKLSGSSKQLHGGDKAVKRLKVSSKSEQMELDFKLNPVALDLFGSLPNSRSNDSSKPKDSTSLLRNDQAKVALSSIARDLEQLSQGDSPTIRKRKKDPPPRSNNGVVFLIDGVTAGSCISLFKKKKAIAECFVTKKLRQKKNSSPESVAYHVHPSVGHQLTYFCARHVARWKLPTPYVGDAKGRSEYKVFVITKDSRFSMLMMSLKEDGVDVALVKDLSNLRTLLDSLVK